MFNNLSEKFSKVINNIKGKPLLDEKEIKATLREIRIILLEADVALEVVKNFLSIVEEIALKDEKIKSVTTGQQLIKIVFDQLVNILMPPEGEEKLHIDKKPPAVILMLGLQGSGKTTSSAKLARYLLAKKKHVLLASLDVNRPAAQEQLAILGKEINVDSLEIIKGQSAKEIAKRAHKKAKEGHYDVLILDSAGRTTIDDAQMQELKDITKIVNIDEKLLVVDALTGQDAINTAKKFNEEIKLTGSILSRMDGDQRGGVAISLRAVTGVAIKFLGSGEKVSDLDEFDAKKIADRIFDKGDIVSLVEQAKEQVDQDDALRMAKKVAKGKFDLDDLAKQFQTMRKMGGFQKIASMMPGMGGMSKKIGDVGDSQEKEIIRSEAILSSMTKEERKNPKILNASRKKRIAKGAGVQIFAINKLLKAHMQMEKMVKSMRKKGNKGNLMSMLGMDPSMMPENIDESMLESQLPEGMKDLENMDLDLANLDFDSNIDNLISNNKSSNNLLPGLGGGNGKNTNLPGLEQMLKQRNKNNS